jgi:hypothetical protein
LFARLLLVPSFRPLSLSTIDILYISRGVSAPSSGKGRLSPRGTFRPDSRLTGRTGSNNVTNEDAKTGREEEKNRSSMLLP